MRADSEARGQPPGKVEPEKPKRRPGDLILDKYMPNATPEEREEARYNLMMYAEAVIALNKRIEEEKQKKETKGDQPTTL